MRGILVVLVLCLASSALAACNGRASADGTGCICASGYSGAGCATAGLSACTSQNLVPTEATHFPNLAVGTADPLTSPIRFVGNHLFARIDGFYVAKRSYKELTFTPSAAQAAAGATDVNARCHLGNTDSYWTQGTNAGPCNDTFHLDMPWANHVSCGFANNTVKSNSEFMFITGYLFIQYVDDLGEVDGFNLTRSTKVPFSVSVKFQRHVTVHLQALNVTSDVKYGMALTEDTYDPENMILTLEITSIVNWPNKFYTGQSLPLIKPDQVLPELIDSMSPPQLSGAGPLLYCPNGVCAAGSGAPRQVFTWDAGCSAVEEKSLCTQKFLMKAKVNQTHARNCTYDGEYHVTAPLYTCRETSAGGSAPDCTSALLNISFVIDQSYVCGEIGVAPHVEGRLYAFDPQYVSNFAALVDQNKQITNFQLGKYGHFYAGLKTDDNTVGIYFREISFTVQSKSNWVRLYNSSGWRDTGDFAESYPAQPAVVSGFVYTDKKYFRVYFHSSIFKVNPNDQVIYTFRATIDLSFKGNQHFENPQETRKRTIETTWEQTVTSAETNVFMRAAPTSAVAPAEQVLPTDNGVSSVTFIASVVGAVAGTMIIVFVVVGFALRARSQTKDEPHSSLVAASAAAAEVANRA